MRLFAAICLSVALMCGSSNGATTHTLSKSRINEIAKLLPEKPEGPGKPITDREFWQNYRSSGNFESVIAQARSAVTAPIPDLPDELYLEFSTNGNRNRYEAQTFARRNRLTPLVMAECMENSGEF